MATKPSLSIGAAAGKATAMITYISSKADNAQWDNFIHRGLNVFASFCVDVIIASYVNDECNYKRQPLYSHDVKCALVVDAFGYQLIG